MIKNIIRALRPRQWTKNIALFAGLIFSQNFFHLTKTATVLAAVLIFCIASSSIYLFNDVLDIEQDRKHPLKRLRPIASGQLSKSFALMIAYVLIVWSMAMAFLLDRNFSLLLAVYFIIGILYSVCLKNIVIIDLFCIASGFLLRVLCGVVVIGVPISHWLLSCTIFLSLFLALGKRRAEMVLLKKEALEHRSVLCEYSLSFIDQMITIVAASTILSYVLYTFSSETIAKFHTNNLSYSVPFVIYGVFRYLYLLYQKNEGGSPEKLLFSHKPLLYNLICYLVVVVAIIYR